MNMTQLEYFLAICKYNNISKAATQSLVTPTHTDIPVYCQLEPNLFQSICIGYHINKYVTRPMRSFIECAKEKLNSMNWQF